jgi:mannose-1-phosphate guanylyltransferase
MKSQTMKKLESNNQALTYNHYLWNSGMFKAGVFLDELKKYSPKIYETCKIAKKIKIQHSHMEAIQ